MTEEHWAVAIERRLAQLEAEMKNVKAMIAALGKGQQNAPAADAPDTPDEETERERNGRLWFKCYESAWEGIRMLRPADPWTNHEPYYQEICKRASERFLAAVRPTPDYGALRPLAADARDYAYHEHNDPLFSFANKVLLWLDEQEADRE